MSIRGSFINSVRHAFAVDPESDTNFTESERELAGRVAPFIAQRRMSAPAVMFLESGKPLNFLGSQLMTFLAPFVTLIFTSGEYERFVRFLEKRGSIDLILDSISEAESRD